ncbi:MAG: translation initiation factor IF-2 [Helicobacteraceae bacterium]|jgi:translation initiation factor IF-2|nr:translation initiation factor IF-2 [Helicobacteraceae bacterium]
MSDKVRVHEIAKELGIDSKEVVVKAAEIGLDIKTASSSVSMNDAEKIANYIINGAPAPKPATPVVTVKKAAKKEDEAPSNDEKAVDKKPAEPVEAKASSTEVPTAEAVEAKSEPSAEAADEAPKAEAKPAKEMPAGLTKSVVPIKRSGLKIVKKKKPKIDVEVAAKAASAAALKVSSYGKVSEDVLRELQERKAKKRNKSGAAKKTGGQSMDIFGGSMSDVSMDYENDQVVLLDLREVKKEVPKEEPRKPRPPRPAGRNSNAGKNAGSNRGRQVSRGKRKKYTKTVENEIITHVEIPEDIRVYEFAEALGKSMSEVIKVLLDLGMMVTKNDFLKKDEIEILAEEFDVEVTTIDPKDAFNYEEEYDEAGVIADEELVERPPVITIMGHVDHGKTSLLDAIRSARVASGEAGGITQHIGAYSIEKNGKKITFLDTPGHAAFSAMRARGAQVTDIIIIVVAADDGVKPQTEEAIKHAKEAGVPVIIAVNKMDKESANPELVKGQMAERGITPIDWGGDVEFIPVSAKTGEGIDTLLENILLTAEVLELKGNPEAMAKAVVVESTVEKGRGPVATVIVQNGTLNVGDNVVCGAAYGRVKAMVNDQKQMVTSLGLSETAVIVGLNMVPPSGEVMIAMESDKETRELATKRADYDRMKELSASTKTSLDELTALITEGNLKQLKVVLKTDVHGSLEAIRTSLTELRNEEVKVEVISSGVGGVTENDVELVNNSENCVLLAFNVRPTGTVKASAKQKGVEIRTYTIIYQLIDDITGMLTGMMAPKYSEEHSGQADVRETFKIPKGMVAGCMVVDGKMVRGELVRVIRDGIIIHEGRLDSLKRFKDDVKEVGKGLECGVVLHGYEDVKVGDVIETFVKVEQKVEL